MSHRSAARAVARRTLSQTLAHTIGCVSAVTAVLTIASAAPASASPSYARPGHAASTSGGKSGRSTKMSKGSKSTNRTAKHTAKRDVTSRSHATANRTQGRHPHASREPRMLHAVAETRAVLPVVPIVPAIDLHLGGTAVSTPALALAAIPGSDTLVGRSGKLRARFLVPSTAIAATFAGAAKSIAGLFPYLRRVFGDTATRVAPGVYEAPATAGRPPFAFITMLPFSEKVAGRIGDYRIGFWPGESARRLTSSYGNPTGFIEVTAANQATYVSEHFKLGDFLTHDQQDVWPKYLVLHEQLLDKLELVLDDLRSHGYEAERLHVMSGFRTPQYNQSGGDPSGRAELSRHQYGDAADVWVENGTGMMADLNGDGRIDARDAAVLAAAADRVEQAHPELVGGVGIYRGNGAHGPFVHIDTRGARARWGHG